MLQKSNGKQQPFPIGSWYFLKESNYPAIILDPPATQFLMMCNWYLSRLSATLSNHAKPQIIELHRRRRRRRSLTDYRTNDMLFNLTPLIYTKYEHITIRFICLRTPPTQNICVRSVWSHPDQQQHPRNSRDANLKCKTRESARYVARMVLCVVFVIP